MIIYGVPLNQVKGTTININDISFGTGLSTVQAFTLYRFSFGYNSGSVHGPKLYFNPGTEDDADLAVEKIMRNIPPSMRDEEWIERSIKNIREYALEGRSKWEYWVESEGLKREERKDLQSIVGYYLVGIWRDAVITLDSGIMEAVEEAKAHWKENLGEVISGKPSLYLIGGDQ